MEEIIKFKESKSIVSFLKAHNIDPNKIYAHGKNLLANLLSSGYINESIELIESYQVDVNDVSGNDGIIEIASSLPDTHVLDALLKRSDLDLSRNWKWNGYLYPGCILYGISMHKYRYYFERILAATRDRTILRKALYNLMEFGPESRRNPHLLRDRPHFSPMRPLTPFYIRSFKTIIANGYAEPDSETIERFKTYGNWKEYLPKWAPMINEKWPIMFQQKVLLLLMVMNRKHYFDRNLKLFCIQTYVEIYQMTE